MYIQTHSAATRCLAIGLAIVCGLLLDLPAPAGAQETTLAVTVQPTAGSTTSGLATLTAEALGTAVQLLVVGAPEGAFAAIHTGTCADFEPLPLYLMEPLDAGGLSLTPVPAQLEELQQGYAILVHAEQSDSRTPLACGDIPSSGGPAPAAATPIAAAGSFTSPTYGFSLSWDAPWQQVPTATANADVIQLINGPSTLIVEGSRDPGRPLESCPSDFATLLLQTPNIQNIGAATDDAGQVIAGTATGRAWAGYRFTVTLEGDVTEERIAYVECRQAGPGVRVQITHIAKADVFQDEVAKRDEIVMTLTIPSQPPAVVTPTPVPAPTPVATNPDCAGAAEWYAAVRPILDQWDALKQEAARIVPVDPVLALIQLQDIADRGNFLASDLNALTPPPAAATAHQDLVLAWMQAVDATYRLILAIEQGDRAGVTTISGELDLTDQADLQGRRAITDAMTGCG